MFYKLQQITLRYEFCELYKLCKSYDLCKLCEVCTLYKFCNLYDLGKLYEICYMNYKCRLYELFESCKLYEYNMNHLEWVEIAWNHLIFRFQKIWILFVNI